MAAHERQASSNTPPRSRASSEASMSSSRRSRANLSLDFSDLPPLIHPSPPSNTLLVTNLNNPAIFASNTLSHLHQLVNNAIPADIDGYLHSFSPLPSFRRIILTFTTTAAATAVRTLLDGESLPAPQSTQDDASTDSKSAERIRVYFGADTPLHVLNNDPAYNHLRAPQSTKQFFISPPPSPPAGWSMREEDPPNKEVHAEDLLSALDRLTRDAETAHNVPASQLSSGPSASEVPVVKASETEPDGRPAENGRAVQASRSNRQRSGSTTIVYQPEEHGHSPDLPAISVEDTTGDNGAAGVVDEEVSPVEVEMEGDGIGGGRVFAHTARPPVELMS